MNLILTSDFPSTSHARISERMRATGAAPRIAWIPPSTDAAGTQFAAARARFTVLGFHQLECVDIDDDRDEVQIAYLHEFDVIYLSGGDPVRFRHNAIRSGLAGRLRQCIASNRLIIGASSGALLLTPNVSLYRLAHDSLEDVLTTRGRFDALAVVAYELLPHLHRWDASFLAKVRDYSRALDHDIVCLPDGAAMFHSGDDAVESSGAVLRYRKGHIIDTGVES
jgi:peptidase E